VVPWRNRRLDLDATVHAEEWESHLRGLHERGQLLVAGEIIHSAGVDEPGRNVTAPPDAREIQQRVRLIQLQLWWPQRGRVR
jgi:hypothetical protein